MIEPTIWGARNLVQASQLAASAARPHYDGKCAINRKVRGASFQLVSCFSKYQGFLYEMAQMTVPPKQFGTFRPLLAYTLYCIMTSVSAQHLVHARGPLGAPNYWPKSAPQSCENPSICCERYVFAGTFSQFCCESLPFAARFSAKGDIFANYLSQKKRTAKARKVDFRRCERCGRRFFGGPEFRPQKT